MCCKTNRERFWMDPDFHDNEDHVQRCTVPAWRDALLHNQDQVVIKGCVRKLVGKDIGFSVVEVTLAK